MPAVRQIEGRETMGTVSFIQADARTLPIGDGVVQCAVTSPPYFSLRDYGVAGQLGLEGTPEAYIAAMVDVFREVKRVLRDDGTLWLNIGDSYAGSGRGGNPDDSPHKLQRSNRGSQTVVKFNTRQETFGLKPKDLIGIPWMLAFALRADGWYLRSEIVWSKRAPMPESVRDRPTRSHEQLFLLTKRPDYYYDLEAVKEPMAEASAARYAYGFGGAKSVALVEADKTGMGVRTRVVGSREAAPGRNRRTVWTLSTEGCRGAHFATFPTKLIEPCIMAGTSERGCCPLCRAPWKRVVDRVRVPTRPGVDSKVYAVPPLDASSPYQMHAGDICGNRDPRRHVTATTTTAWIPGCKCPAHDPVPCLVLDNFAGAFTTAIVADRLGRSFVGTELNPAYIALGRQRLADDRAKRAAFRPKRSRVKAAPASEPSLFGEVA